MAKIIRIERQYRFTPEQVWTALTDPQCLAAWLMTTDFEPVVGRKFQFRAKPQPGWKGVVDGVVREVALHQRLAYEWVGSPKAKPTRLVWTLTPNANGTLLTLEHSDFEGVGGWFLRLMMERGWLEKLDAGLPRVLEALAQGKADQLKPKYRVSLQGG